jgi:ABC-2 type transport system ATP-binding protein
MEPLLELRNVSKNYQSKCALDEASLSIPRGSIYGLLGPNGAGKTTMIRIITHITAPDSGEVIFNGRLSQPEDVLSMGYMPEERGLYKKMTVWDQLLFFARLKGLSGVDAEQRIVHWLKKLDLADWARKKVEELSKGMAQKVQFIATVIHRPDFLILDEPFSGFDPVNADIIKNEILELRRQGVTILFSTHRMESVESLCDSICLINQSRIVLDGSVREIRSRYKNQRYLLGTTSAYDCRIPGVSLAPEEPAGDMQYRYSLRFHAIPDTRALLHDVLNQTEVLHFEEHLPSVHDIFVMQVKGGLS